MTYRIIFHQGTDKDKGGSDDELAKSQRAMSILPYGENPNSKLKGWLEKPEAEEMDRAESVVYHDLDCGNQDPYIWHERFLHSMCKFNKKNYDKYNSRHLNVYCESEKEAMHSDDVHFLCTSKEKKNIAKMDGLYCDVVFWVEHVVPWDKNNLPNCGKFYDLGILTTPTPWEMLPTDPDYHQNLAYWDHIFWAAYDHPWVEAEQGKVDKDTRHTLVADPDKSFQPQHGCIARVCREPLLVDLTDFLCSNGVYHDLQQALGEGRWGMELPYHIGSKLYDFLAGPGFSQIRGRELQRWREEIAQNGVYEDKPFRLPEKAKLPPFIITRIGKSYALKDWHGNLYDRRFHDIKIGIFRSAAMEGNWFFLGQEGEGGGWKVYYIETKGASEFFRNPVGRIKDTGRYFISGSTAAGKYFDANYKLK